MRCPRVISLSRVALLLAGSAARPAGDDRKIFYPLKGVTLGGSKKVLDILKAPCYFGIADGDNPEGRKRGGANPPG